MVTRRRIKHYSPRPTVPLLRVVTGRLPLQEIIHEFCCLLSVEPPQGTSNLGRSCWSGCRVWRYIRAMVDDRQCRRYRCGCHRHVCCRGQVNWLSAITAVSRLFSALTGLFRDWQLRRRGAKEARLLPLEAEQFRAKRLPEITAHLDTLDDNELDLRLGPNQRATGRLRMGKANHRGRGK